MRAIKQAQNLLNQLWIGHRISAEIEHNRLYNGGEGQKDHWSYFFCFFFFQRTPEFLAKDASDRFCSVSNFSNLATILAS